MDKKKLYMIIGVVMVLSCIAEISGVHMHHPHWWPLPFGYDIFFGFVGGWILIIMAKLIMAPILQRDERYYEDGGDEDE